MLRRLSPSGAAVEAQAKKKRGAEAPRLKVR